MAVITFPRVLPYGLIGVSFKPMPMQELTPLRSGKTIAADLGPTLWQADYQSPAVAEDQLGVLRAWYDTLLSEGQLYGYDLLREYPYAYRATGWTGLLFGGNPFTGSGRLTAVAANNVEISLDQLPVGFALAPGDYLAWDYLSGTARALHRISAAGVASGGGTMTIEVRPHVRAGWAVNAPAGFYRPAARMFILPNTYSETVGTDRNARVSFQTIQTL